MDYLKNTVLARKGSSEDEPDEGGDTPDPSPEPELTPVTPELEDTDPTPDPHLLASRW